MRLYGAFAWKDTAAAEQHMDYYLVAAEGKKEAEHLIRLAFMEAANTCAHMQPVGYDEVRLEEITEVQRVPGANNEMFGVQLVPQNP